MTTFKQFLQEKIDDNPGPGYREDVRKEMIAASKDIARSLKRHWTEVPIHIATQQDFQQRRFGVDGDVYVLKTHIPEDMDSDFYAKMVGKLAQRELSKKFGRLKVMPPEVARYTALSGTKIDTAYVTFVVPDPTGRFSVSV